MGNPKKGIGERIQEWLENLRPWKWVVGYDAAVRKRYGWVESKEGQDMYKRWSQTNPAWQVWLIFWSHIYFSYPSKAQLLAGDVFYKEIAYKPLEFMSDEIVKVMKDEDLIRTMTALGSVFYDPLIALLSGSDAPADEEPEDFARRFYGLVTMISLVPRIPATAIELASGGKLKTQSDAMKDVYWMLGLGFLTWQVLAPVLSAGLGKRMEEKYNIQFRPERFTRAQVMNLFALGEWGSKETKEALRALGFREKDIPLLLALAFRQLSRSDVVKYVKKGWITPDEGHERLRRLGYALKERKLILREALEEDVDEAKRITLTQARRGFIEGLISVRRFRLILEDLGYTKEAIEIEVATSKQRKVDDRRRLQTGQIKSGYIKNTITKVEAQTFLADLKYRPLEVGELIEQWDVEKLPKWRKLNQATIGEAFAAGVLSYNQAMEKLVALPMTRANARIIIQTWIKQGARKPLPREMTTYQVKEGYVLGVIPPPEARQRLRAIGWAKEEIARLLEAWDLQKVPRFRLLNVGAILTAFVDEIITQEETREKLRALDYRPADITILIHTALAEKARREPPPPPEPTPTIGALLTATRRGIITTTELAERLRERRFTEEDIRIYTSIATWMPPEEATALTKAEILRLYKKGIIVGFDAFSRLIGKGYSIQDADYLMRDKVPEVRDSQIVDLLAERKINPQQAYDWLVQLGYFEEEVRNYLVAAGYRVKT